MRRIVAGLLALSAAVSLAAFTGAARADAFEDILKKGVVRIAVPLDVPPFGSQNEKREPEGFDVEFAGMIAKALGREARAAADHRRQSHPLPAHQQGRHRDLGDGADARARQADHVHVALRRHAACRLRAQERWRSPRPTSWAAYKVAATKGSTQEIGLTAMNPKAQIMRTEDDATSATAYLSGQAELFATNSLLIPDLQKRNPNKEFEVKFTIRRSPAHIGVRMGEHNLVRWLDSFIFFNTMNGEIDRLHQKWLGVAVRPAAVAVRPRP